MENKLSLADKLTGILRTLYEKQGYQRYRMSNFESYDIYRENKNFLENEGIITFNDTRGRLMALKPDVTLSIVKNTKNTAVSEKRYYVENVFRAGVGGECKEINQMGLECIGTISAYAQAEVVALALQTLAATGENFVLTLNHMGIVTGLMDALHLPEALRGQTLVALRQKNAQELFHVAQQAGCTQLQCQQLSALASLSGEFEMAITQAKSLASNCETVQQALCELELLYATLKQINSTAGLRLDASVIQDIDYYNGLVMKGYLESVPHAVLSGGRYDNLLHRMGKPQGALGFALYLGELERALQKPVPYDVDTLLLYEETQSAATVANCVQTLLSTGVSVRTECVPVPSLRARCTMKINQKGCLEDVL